MPHGKNFSRLQTLAARYPDIEREEEVALARHYRAGRTEAGNRIIAAHFRYALRVALRYATSDHDLPDAFSDACLGLMAALERFDPGQGVRFSTYASYHCRRTLGRGREGRARQVRFGQSSLERTAMKIVRSREWVQRNTEHSQDVLERLASRYDVPESLIVAADVHLRAGAIHLDSAGEIHTGHLAGRPYSIEDNLDERLDRERVCQRIAENLPQLSERERAVLVQRYFAGVPKSQAATGAALGVSQQRVQQLETSAVVFLRDRVTRPVPGRARRSDGPSVA